VQPVFNRDVIAALSDSAASSLLELEAWINGEDFIGPRDAIGDPSLPSGSQTTLTNLESDLIASITHNNSSSAATLLDQVSLYSEEERRTTITTVFLRTIADGSLELLQSLLDTGYVDTSHIDEITDRGCLHEAAIAGRLDVIQICIQKGTSLTSY
jgi:CDK inhibitor PHO81